LPEPGGTPRPEQPSLIALQRIEPEALSVLPDRSDNGAPDGVLRGHFSCGWTTSVTDCDEQMVRPRVRHRAYRRSFVLRWNGGDGASMLRSSILRVLGLMRRAMRGACCHRLSVGREDRESSGKCAMRGTWGSSGPWPLCGCASAPPPPQPFRFQPGRSHRVATGARAGPAGMAVAAGLRKAGLYRWPAVCKPGRYRLPDDLAPSRSPRREDQR
jgi:hypothetical protein